MSPVNKKGQIFLHLAVQSSLSRSVEMVSVPLENGIAISAQDQKGSSALHLAG